MNGLYDILLFLFILGAATQGINELGAFGHEMPDAGLQLQETNVRELNTAAQNQGSNEFNWLEVFKSFMMVIGAGALAMVTVIPMIAGVMQSVGVEYGLAILMAGILQAPITFVTLFGLYEWWTGRVVT